MDIKTLAAEINARSNEYSFGKLQELRADLKGLKRVSGTMIFSAQTTFDEWAFHLGGRSELQFNIGLEHLKETQIILFATD